MLQIAHFAQDTHCMFYIDIFHRFTYSYLCQEFLLKCSDGLNVTEHSELLGTVPLSYLNLNLHAPVAGIEPLMTTHELKILFHEVGALLTFRRAGTRKKYLSLKLPTISF